MNIYSVTNAQYTERTHHGDFFRYRISTPTQSFADFMRESPYYFGDPEFWTRLDRQLRTPRNNGKVQFGWSDFTRTSFPARVLVQITDVKTLNNSVSGNPRFRLTGKRVDTGETESWITQSDGRPAYEVRNYTNTRRVMTNMLRHGRITTLVLTRAGRVFDLEYDGMQISEIERRIYG